jgi:hypothetical protein
MNSDTFKREHMICHIGNDATSSIQGDHISTCFLFMHVPCGY